MNKKKKNDIGPILKAPEGKTFFLTKNHIYPALETLIGEIEIF